MVQFYEILSAFLHTSHSPALYVLYAVYILYFSNMYIRICIPSPCHLATVSDIYDVIVTAQSTAPGHYLA